ncbi:MAG: hypothetical protein Q8R28_22565 [Dehalococcoidia bacterium]|nr:hypothetical protein [Dehalococcoidia bacterium]
MAYQPTQRDRYLIRYDDTEPAQRQAYRGQAADRLRVFAAENKIGASGDPGEYIVKDWQPLLDALPAVIPLNRWQTAPLAVVGTYYSVFQNQATIAVRNNQAVAVYSVSVLDPAFPVSRFRIQEGVAGAGTYGDFDLQQMEANLEPTGYLSEPAIFGPMRIMNLTVCSKVATGVVANVVLGMLVVEMFGVTITI